MDGRKKRGSGNSHSFSGLAHIEKPAKAFWLISAQKALPLQAETVSRRFVGTITTYAPNSAFREPPAFLRFEDTLLPGPSDYDRALRHWYGDYMKLPPVSDRTGGHGQLYIDLRQAWTSTTQMPPCSVINYNQSDQVNCEVTHE